MGANFVLASMLAESGEALRLHCLVFLKRCLSDGWDCLRGSTCLLLRYLHGEVFALLQDFV